MWLDISIRLKHFAPRLRAAGARALRVVSATPCSPGITTRGSIFRNVAVPLMLLLSLESHAQNGRDTLGNTVPIERQRALGLDKLTSEQRAGVHELLMDFYQVGVEDGREGKESSSAADSPESADLLSANALYREYRNNPVDANNRYFGNAVVLEGIRGQLLLTGENRAAIHIADGNVSNALILGFENRNQVAGLNQGQRFRFRCTGSDYYEPSLFMKNCVVVR